MSGRAPSIRPYRGGDDRGILEVHHAAVHQGARREYPPSLLDAWAPPVTPARIAAHAARLAEGHERKWVADEAGRICGFAAYLPATGALSALYVHPGAAGRGLGLALLRAVESHARALGIPELWLDASLNAEGFYRRQGYTGGPIVEHRLLTGEPIRCVPMRRRL